MSDIKVSLQADGSYDIPVEDGDLAGVDGFDTAIWVSVFTDARAPESKVILPEFRRGWLGDTESPVADRALGGFLWIAEQRRLNQDTLNEVEDYVLKSLIWMIEDSIAKSVTVVGTIVPRYGISLKITINTPQGASVSHYVKLWEVTG